MQMGSKRNQLAWLLAYNLWFKALEKENQCCLCMDRPCTSTELRQFIGCVNYYSDMWPSRAHVLQPLTDQSGLKKGVPIQWSDAHQHAFDKMRHLMAADALAANPDHNKRFDIYTDASDFQLGACIMQDGQPVAYFSRKLNKAQKNYTTMEKELLSIVKVLTKFCTMLLGAVLHIHTDHLNITTNNITPDCIICWLNYIEQFNPYIHFISGKYNIIAKTLSWLDHLEESILSKEKQVFVLKDSVSKGMDFANDPLLIECFLHLPPLAVQDTNPTNYQWIFDKQNETNVYS